ncbi:MAG TPA: MFS transporter [Armatimonadaceae bacterium]|nr:MFS transporter [Armatimonadaceae bacterium]
MRRPAPQSEPTELAANEPPAPAPARGGLAALQFRNFRLFLGGQLVSLAGTWMQLVAQQWLVYSLTKSSAWLGIVTGAGALPTVLFSLLGGHLADRFPRRTILIVTQVAAMLLAGALALLAWGRWIPIQPWHIAALAALSGVVNAFNMPAQQAFVPEMVEDRAALGSAIALNSILFNTARFLGPVLAGLVLVRYGAAACFAANAVSYLAVIVSLVLIRVPRAERQGTGESVWAGFRFLWREKSVFRTVSLVGASSLLIWSVSTLYPVLADAFGRGAGGYTMVMAVNGIGAALGGALVAGLAHRFDRRLVVYGAPVVFCAGFLGISLAPTFWAMLAALFVAGAAMVTFGVSAQTKVQSDVPDALRGRVMAVYSLVFSGMMPVGGLAIGFVAERIGAASAIRLNVFLCLAVVAALFAWSNRDLAATRRAAAVDS